MNKPTTTGPPTSPLQIERLTLEPSDLDMNANPAMQPVTPIRQIFELIELVLDGQARPDQLHQLVEELTPLDPIQRAEFLRKLDRMKSATDLCYSTAMTVGIPR